MENVIDKLKELAIKRPELKDFLNEHISIIQSTLEKQNQFYDYHAKKIAGYNKIFILSFEIALEGSINKKELINIELKDIQNLLEKGEILNALTVSNFSSLIPIEKKYSEIYIKLIKGLELDLLEKAVDEQDLNLINQIAIVRALCLFSDYLKALLNQSTPQQAETETEQVTPTFINNFDNIKPAEVYNHFKIGLVDKGYLTEQELNDYLKTAFELKTIPETLFKLKHTPTKQKIYTVFYIYYKDISQKKHERQKEYAALLGDFFEGYKTEIIQTNWARDYKIKR